MGDDPSRHTKPRDLEQLPVLSEDEIVALEASNGLKQFDRTIELVRAAIESGRFSMRPSMLIELNRLAIAGLEPSAGQYRQRGVRISGTAHRPPPWEDVPALVEEMCEYVNDRPDADDALQLASFVMWRLNWIHPWANGNGRTSRVVSYLVLCVRLGVLLPGTRTIPDLIATDKRPYYAALDAADAAWRLGNLDVTAMERLLSEHLSTQLSGH